MAELVVAYEDALPPGGWPNWVLGNHDQSRIAARVGDAQAGIAAMLLLTLRGTPTLYYGDEIGLAHVTIPPDRVQDPWERNEPGHGRDPERTPMQWDNSRNAGFSVGQPWLPLSLDAAVRNVEGQCEDAQSLLTLYRRLLRLRRDYTALSTGEFRRLSASTDFVFVYERHDSDATLCILLNFSASPQMVNDTFETDSSWEILLSTNLDRHAIRFDSALVLAANEGLILLRNSVGIHGAPRISV